MGGWNGEIKVIELLVIEMITVASAVNCFSAN